MKKKNDKEKEVIKDVVEIVSKQETSPEKIQEYTNLTEAIKIYQNE